MGSLDNEVNVVKVTDGSVVATYMLSSNIKSLKYLPSSGSFSAFLYSGDVVTLQ